MSLTNWRYSKFFRITAIFILINFLISQTAFAQDQFQVQEGTHLYTPVKPVDQLPSDGKGDRQEVLPVPFSVTDFWNETLEMFDLNLLLSFCGVDALVLWR